MAGSFQDPLSGTVGEMSIEGKPRPRHQTWPIIIAQMGLPALKRQGYKRLLQDLDLGLETRLAAKVLHLSGGPTSSINFTNGDPSYARTTAP